MTSRGTNASPGRASKGPLLFRKKPYPSGCSSRIPLVCSTVAAGVCKTIPFTLNKKPAIPASFRCQAGASPTLSRQDARHDLAPRSGRWLGSKPSSRPSRTATLQRGLCRRTSSKRGPTKLSFGCLVVGRVDQGRPRQSPREKIEHSAKTNGGAHKDRHTADGGWPILVQPPSLPGGIIRPTILVGAPSRQAVLCAGDECNC